MLIAVTHWPETPNPYAHTFEVLFELHSGELVGFDLVVVGSWVGWFTTDGRLVRTAEPGCA